MAFIFLSLMESILKMNFLLKKEDNRLKEEIHWNKPHKETQQHVVLSRYNFQEIARHCSNILTRVFKFT